MLLKQAEEELKQAADDYGKEVNESTQTNKFDVVKNRHLQYALNLAALRFFQAKVAASHNFWRGDGTEGPCLYMTDTETGTCGILKIDHPIKEK